MRLFLLLALVYFSPLLSQEDLNLSYFYAQQVNSKVALNFELRQGSVCSGIRIERRTGNENFTQIGVIPGICGSEDYPESYVWEDENPVLGEQSYYRLVLEGLGQSKEVLVFAMDFTTRTYQLAIEPESGKLAIYFKNDQNFEVEIHYYNLQGGQVGSYTTQTNYFLIPEKLHNSTYLFVIKGELTSIQGKVHVQ